jgi:cell division protein FtsQ
MRMTSVVTTVSPSELKGRRIALRRQKRRQVVHRIWRAFAVSSLAGGLVWGATQPAWVISKPTQIDVEGNQRLSDEAVRSLLSLTYPQSLLRIEPQAMIEKLTYPNSTIANATITRQLFPPSLTVQVEERQPVAIAVSTSPSLPRPTDAAAKPMRGARSLEGLLDAEGTLIPLESYQALNAAVPQPQLKIIGLPPQQLSNWPQIYQVLRGTQVKIFEMDWQNPANIILKTELGLVHLGRYSPQISAQINVLDRLRALPKKLTVSEIAYIDLKEPESPAIQMIQSNPVTKPKPARLTAPLGKGNHKRLHHRLNRS